MLANSIGSREILEYAASYPEGQALTTEIMKVEQEILNLQEDVIRLESQANHEEGALMRAMVVWDILNQYTSGKSQAVEQSTAQNRLIIEKDAVQQLYRMFQTKGNHFQGQDIEILSKEAREKLQFKVEHALYLIQERQAKIRSKAPRYSFNLDPKIFEDEGELLQQEFQVDMEETQPAAFRFYKNVQAEVLETAEQLKNLKTTALRVAGIKERGDENLDRVVSSQDNERSYDSRMATNSNMLSEMMRKRGDTARDFSVEDTSGNQAVEGTTQAWLQSQQQEQNQYQSTQSWLSQNQVPSSSQFSQALGPTKLQMPSGRPFPGMQQAQNPFVPIPSQTSYGPTFSGPMLRNNATSMNQPVLMRPSNQPNTVAAQSFSPRGFQQQVSSMPRPPAPNWSAQQPALQPMMPPGNFAQMPLHTMGLNEHIRFNTLGAMLPQSAGVMTHRQQPGLRLPASQVPSHFTMPRMQPPPSLGPPFPQSAGMSAEIKQQMMKPQAGAMPQPNSLPPMQVRMRPLMAWQQFPQTAGNSSQMQQQMMKPVAGAMTQPSSIPPLQARVPPAMAQQNFWGSPQMAPAQQKLPRPPIRPTAATQQTFNQPTQMGLAPQNFISRPRPYDPAMSQRAAMQFGGPRPQRPL